MHAKGKPSAISLSATRTRARSAISLWGKSQRRSHSVAKGQSLCHKAPQVAWPRAFPQTLNSD